MSNPTTSLRSQYPAGTKVKIGVIFREEGFIETEIDDDSYAIGFRDDGSVSDIYNNRETALTSMSEDDELSYVLVLDTPVVSDPDEEQQIINNEAEIYNDGIGTNLKPVEIA